jgi:hypothetical protein
LQSILLSNKYWSTFKKKIIKANGHIECTLWVQGLVLWCYLFVLHLEGQRSIYDQRSSHFYSLWISYVVCCLMVFNATFHNISIISWRSVLLVEETGLPRENHRPVVSHWQTLLHNVVSSTPCHERDSNSQI